MKQRNINLRKKIYNVNYIEKKKKQELTKTAGKTQYVMYIYVHYMQSQKALTFKERFCYLMKKKMAY